jgi:hypothetical protein
VAVVAGLLSCIFVWLAAPRNGASLRQQAIAVREAL